MTHPTDTPPIRQLMRLHTEMFMGAAERNGGMFPDAPSLAVEFGMVARVCLIDWAPDGMVAAPRTPGRAITIRRLGLALGRPAETVRRRVTQLIDRGAFVALADGVALATTDESAARAIAYYHRAHDVLIRLIEDIQGTCDVAFQVGTDVTVTRHDVIARALDLLLRSIDTFRPAKVSASAYYLWGALIGVAVRDVTFDPVLSRRYATAIPPDDVRRSMSLHRLAGALKIPYSTAWRHMRDLHAAGLVTRLADDSWTVLTRNLQDPQLRTAGEPPALTSLRMARDLALLGLDPACASRWYIDGRPPLATLG